MRHFPAAMPRIPLKRFALEKRGNFAVMAALCAPIAIALSAFAIDEGSLFTERREVQALADLAAITAAANIDNVETAVLTTLKDNGLSDVAVHKAGEPAEMSAGGALVDIRRGRYTADPALGADKRFEAGKQPFNAVEVSLRKTGTLYFGGAIMDPPTIGATAVASTSAQAAFSVGSRLLKVDGGIVNALLGGLVGGTVSLSVVDYDALIDADVDVLSFIDALAVQSHMTGVTYSDVLGAEVTIGQVATAMAAIPGLDRTSKLALRSVAASAAGTAKFRLGNLVDLGPVGRLALGQRPAGLSVDAAAMGMLTAAAALANGTNQVQIDLGATIPGLTSTTLDIAIGEPQQFSPWLAVGEAGTVVRTAQIRVRLLASVGIGNSGPGGGIKLLSVSLPLHVEVAHAEARLTDISCAAGQRPTVTIAARPGVASLRIGESDSAGFADFSRPQSFHDAKIAEVSVKLLLLTLNLLRVDGSASTAIANTAATTLTFDSADIAGKKVKTISTRNITQSLTTSLVEDLSVSVGALGLGLDVTALLGTVKPAVVTVLDAVTGPVDTLLYNVLGMLGVRVGQADVRVTGATCGRSVLVQ